MKTKRSWLFEPPIEVTVSDAVVEIDRWVTAQSGRTAVIDIDSATRPPIYCVWVDAYAPDNTLLFEHVEPAKSLRDALRAAVTAIREYEQRSRI